MVRGRSSHSNAFLVLARNCLRYWRGSSVDSPRSANDADLRASVSSAVLSCGCNWVQYNEIWDSVFFLYTGSGFTGYTITLARAWPLLIQSAECWLFQSFLLSIRVALVKEGEPWSFHYKWHMIWKFVKLSKSDRIKIAYSSWENGHACWKRRWKPAASLNMTQMNWCWQWAVDALQTKPIAGKNAHNLHKMSIGLTLVYPDDDETLQWWSGIIV